MNLTKMRAGILLFLVMLLSITIANAQDLKVDSLENLIKKHPTEDTTRVNLLIEYARAIFEQDTEKAKPYAEQAGKMADRLNYPKGKAGSLWIIGLTSLKADKKIGIDYIEKALAMGEKAGDKVGICKYMMSIAEVRIEQGDIEKSNELLERAHRIGKEIKSEKIIMESLYLMTLIQARTGDYPGVIRKLEQVIDLAKETGDQAMLGKAYGRLSNAHSRQNNYPAALEYQLAALRISEQLNDKSGIFFNTINISSTQISQKDYDAALKTMKKAFEFAKKEKKSLWIMLSHMSLGGFYRDRNPSYALTHFQKALAIAKDNHASNRITILTHIGVIHRKKGEYDKAMKTYEEALALAEKVGAKRSYCDLWNNMAVIYSIRKQYDQAINYTQKAINLSKELGIIKFQMASYQQLADLYATTGAFQKAYQSHVLYKTLSDSVFNEQNIRKVAFLESSYEHEKEKKILEIEKMNRDMKIKNQKQIILFLVVVSILVFMLAFAIYWSNKLKKKVLKLKIENINHQLEMNQKAMAAATLKLVQNSERDANSVKMLENIEKNTIEESRQEIRSLITDYKLKSYNSNWEEFEIMFEKINSSFYDKLNERYPTLTPNERKLCVFLKLNMSNMHISQITFQSEEALKKSRLRLRKKLEIDREVNLTAFIQSI